MLPYYHQHAGYQAYSDQYGQYGMHEADPMNSSSDDLEGFARDFKQRRIKLGYTQVTQTLTPTLSAGTREFKRL